MPLDNPKPLGVCCLGPDTSGANQGTYPRHASCKINPSRAWSYWYIYLSAYVQSSTYHHLPDLSSYNKLEHLKITIRGDVMPFTARSLRTIHSQQIRSIALDIEKVGETPLSTYMAFSELDLDELLAQTHLRSVNHVGLIIHVPSSEMKDREAWNSPLKTFLPTFMDRGGIVELEIEELRPYSGPFDLRYAGVFPE